MSRDSNYTQVHLHASHHADLFEEFCQPPSSTTPNTTTAGVNTTTQPDPNGQASSSEPGMIHLPGHFLPFEEIHLPPHLMPLNPEDEDDVVPDMHAAFGIQRALGQGGASGVGGEASGRGVQREPAWRDLGMERLLETGGTAGGVGAKREGKRSGVLLMR